MNNTIYTQQTPLSIFFEAKNNKISITAVDPTITETKQQQKNLDKT